MNLQSQSIVGIGQLVIFPVGAFHQTVGSIIHEGQRRILAGFEDAVTVGIIGAGEDLNGGVLLAGLQLGSVIHTQAAPALFFSAGAVGSHHRAVEKR